MATRWLRKTSRALALSVALAGASPLAAQEHARIERPALLLMGTIPVYWGEAGDLADLLDGGATPHWARAVLERRFTLVPVDTLSAATLPAGGGLLLLAQPRTLSPVENVALDAWVRAGGRVLLLADPLMTGESRFSIGDRRRPQDVALLSPLLDHWGLDLHLAEDQQPGLRFVADAGVAIPVNLAGTMATAEGSGCTVSGEGVVARCRLDAGLAIVVADAAMLDIEGPWQGAAESLDSLLSTLSGGDGESVHARDTATGDASKINALAGSGETGPDGGGGPVPPP